MPIEFRIIRGLDTGRTIRFDGFEDLILGRAVPPHPDTPMLTDPYLSRHHCRLRIGHGGARVEDLDSHNGVFLNGNRLTRASLGHRDQLKVGHTCIEVRVIPRRESDCLGSAAHQPDDPLVLGRFERLGLARRGFPEVHHGRDRNDYRPVTLHALRLHSTDPKSALTHGLATLERYRQLEHPNLVPIHGAGVAGGSLFVVSELTFAETLEQAVERDGVFSPEWAASIGRQLLQALHALHYAGLVHARLSPSTVVLDERGGRPFARLVEVGWEEAFRTPGVDVLSAVDNLPRLALPAPEQIFDARGRGPAADLYSVGATLYRALTGASQIDLESDVNPLSSLLAEKQIPIRERRPDLPFRLASLIDRALSSDPAARFESAENMNRALLRTGV